MQNINYRTPERKKILNDMRQIEEERRLGFYGKVHNKGKRIDCDTTLEQPAEAMSWKTRTLERMKGYYETVLDRCRTGLKLRETDELFVKKPTRFRSRSREVAEHMNLSCVCEGPRAQMFGHGLRLRSMQNYEPQLVFTLGSAIYKAMEQAWHRRGQAELMMMEVVEKSSGEMKYLEQNKELIKIGGPEVLQFVAKIHRQLGHPSQQTLLVALKTRDPPLPPEYLKVARNYKCPLCFEKQEPKSVRVATLQRSPHFNHTIAIDTFYVEIDGEKHAVFTVMDEFSRYELDHEITEETADMEIALLESTWMRTFGFPQYLRMDASGPHQGQTYADWASLHGVKLELIPKGAHH